VNTTLLVQLPADLKLKALAKAKQEGKYLSEIVRTALIDFITPKTGRGNTNTDQIEKAKEFLRNNHPKPIRINELANYVGCDQARAARILDILSNGDDFLVYVDDDTPARFGIFKDVKTGIYAH